MRKKRVALTSKQRIELRQDYAANVPMSDIKAKYNIADGTIYRMVKGMRRSSITKFSGLGTIVTVPAVPKALKVEGMDINHLMKMCSDINNAINVLKSYGVSL